MSAPRDAVRILRRVLKELEGATVELRTDPGNEYLSTRWVTEIVVVTLRSGESHAQAFDVAHSPPTKVVVEIVLDDVIRNLMKGDDK